MGLVLAHVQILYPPWVCDKERRCVEGVLHRKPRCYTWHMPTTRPRHVVTETDDIAAALDLAVKRWPEIADSRSRLLVALVKEGAKRVEEQEESALEKRLRAINELSGSMSGVFPPGYLEELRKDWPE